MTRLAPALKAALALPLATLLLTGCSGDEAVEPAGATRTNASATTAERILADYDLDGLPADQVVDRLDRLGGEERPSDLMASVRVDELLLAQGDEETAVPLPEDRFYVSIAPYADSTHDCFFHSLTTCQGELVEEDVDVTITTTDGEVLVDEERTTFANGFVGFWLPRDVEGTIEVSHDGRTGSVEFATGEDDPTCVTTLKLA